jgi:hypothetical protein
VEIAKTTVQRTVMAFDFLGKQCAKFRSGGDLEDLDFLDSEIARTGKNDRNRRATAAKTASFETPHSVRRCPSSALQSLLQA